MMDIIKEKICIYILLGIRTIKMNESLKMHECLKCHIKKDFNDFHKKSDAKLGIISICKVCKKILNADYYKKYKENLVKNDELIKINKIKRKLNYFQNKLDEKYYCKLWNFNAGKKYDFEIHINCKKHKRIVEKFEISKNILNDIISNIWFIW